MALADFRTTREVDCVEAAKQFAAPRFVNVVGIQNLVQFGAESPLPELNKPDTLWSVDTAREKFHQPLEMLDSVVANTLDDIFGVSSNQPLAPSG